MRAISIVLACLFFASHAHKGQAISTRLQEPRVQSLDDLETPRSSWPLVRSNPFKLLAIFSLPFKNLTTGWRAIGQGKIPALRSAALRNRHKDSVGNGDSRDGAFHGEMSRNIVGSQRGGADVSMRGVDDRATRRSVLAASFAIPLTAIAENISFPDIQIENDTIFSRHLEERKSRPMQPRPCVVFFPGDLSDLSDRMLSVLPKEWSLEAIHSVIAGRFPEYDVVTIRGELAVTKEREFNSFVQDPQKAISYLEGLLDKVRSGEAKSKLVLVGFSRGGLGLTSLIEGGESRQDFWRRVEAIHYIDCGGENCFVKELRALRKIAESNRELWLNVQSTNYTANPVNSTGRNRMIALSRDAGLPVNAQEGSGNTFADHMSFLSRCNIDRPTDV